MKPEDKKDEKDQREKKESPLEFHSVTYCKFTNTTSNELYIKHDLNSPNSSTKRVPAKIYVYEQAHKDLLTPLKPGTKIEIRCGFVPGMIQPGFHQCEMLLDLKVPS